MGDIPTRARVVLFEDGSPSSRSLREALEAAGYHVVPVPSFGTALAILREDAISVCVWNRGGSDDSLKDQIRRMRVAGVRWPILLLLARVVGEERWYLREAGADDVIDQCNGAKEVLTRIMAHLSCVERLLLRVLCAGTLVMEPTRGFVWTKEKSGWIQFHLPDKQYAALCLLGEQAGRVVTHSEIQSRLWVGDAAVERKRLYEAVESARRQLRKVSSSFAIDSVREVGYILRIHSDGSKIREISE